MKDMFLTTHIKNKDIIPELLSLGWIVKNNTWTDCPDAILEDIQSLYDGEW